MTESPHRVSFPFFNKILEIKPVFDDTDFGAGDYTEPPSANPRLPPLTYIVLPKRDGTGEVEQYRITRNLSIAQFQRIAGAYLRYGHCDGGDEIYGHVYSNNGVPRVIQQLYLGPEIDADEEQQISNNVTD